MGILGNFADFNRFEVLECVAIENRIKFIKEYELAQIFEWSRKTGERKGGRGEKEDKPWPVRSTPGRVVCGEDEGIDEACGLWVPTSI